MKAVVTCAAQGCNEKRTVISGVAGKAPNLSVLRELGWIPVWPGWECYRHADERKKQRRSA